MEIKHLDSTPPEGQKPTSVMTLEATVDTTKQELRSIRPYFESALSVPKDLTAEAQIVANALLACFDKQGTVEEGKVTDIVWGFSQCGIHPAASLKGLKDLCRAGYLEFQAPDNTVSTNMDHDELPYFWVKYTKKLLDLVYS